MTPRDVVDGSCAVEADVVDDDERREGLSREMRVEMGCTR